MGTPQPPLPRGFGWLLLLVPEAAMFGEMVQRLVELPETLALLKKEPQLGRILRPLCWMFAIRPGPELRLPRRKPRPSAAAPAVPDRRPPDAAEASPRGPGPRPVRIPLPAWSEVAQLSDEELARRIAELRAKLQLIPDPDEPQPA